MPNLLQFKSARRFLEKESASSVVLFVAALLSMIWVNSPLKGGYDHFINTFLFWINEGLMAIFFCAIGLEVKEGYLRGEFSDISQLLLPVVAAVGGMVVPAFIYYLVNMDSPATLRGWATPVATDIAFALGVLSFFGKKIPLSIRLFLLTLAIFDDIGAILIIAFFYSSPLSPLAIFQVATLVVVLFLLNRLSITRLMPYLLVGLLLWVALFYSGIHPTIAGVVVALAIPYGDKKATSPLTFLKDKLTFPVAFLIMPLFAFANAGFPFDTITKNMWSEVVVIGIILGLFLGKQIGVLGGCYLVIKSGLISLPRTVSWLQLYGVALLCGIGFTMSLFLGTLAFQHEPRYLIEIRLGVMVGSLLSGLAGFVILSYSFARNRSKEIG